MAQALINNTDDAFALLSRIEAEGDNFHDEVVFADGVAKLFIKVTGKDYQASFPAEFAKGLGEFQDIYYRAVAQVFYSTDNIKKLTTEQKEQFKLVFKVDEGSTEIWADIKEFLGNLTKDMDSKDKAKVAIALFLFVTLGVGAHKALDVVQAEKEAQIESDMRIKVEEQQTERMRIMKDLATEKINAVFHDANQDASRNLLKRSKGADSLQMGAVRFDKRDIDEVNSRADRERAEARIVSDEFSIVRVEVRETGLSRFVLASKKYGEFSAIIVEEEISDFELGKLWEAARKRESIHLQINMTFIRSEVRSAEIQAVIPRGKAI